MNEELIKFVTDPRYGSLTPEQRRDGFAKLEPRFGGLRDDGERSKFMGMIEAQYRPQMPAVVPGTEKLGELPGPAGSQGAPMREVMTPGKVADVTLGGIGAGVMHTIEGAGGVMRAAGAETAGKAVSDFGAKYGKAPKWLEEVAQSPDRLYDPAFVTNMAFEGLGSSLSFFLPGAAAGKAAAAASKLPIGMWRNIAAWAAGTATGSVMESAVDAGSAYNAAIEKGVKPEVAANIFTETMKREVPVTMLTNAAGEFAPRLGGNVWKKGLQVAFDAAMEGGEEVAQGAAQRSAENAVLGTNTPLLEGAAEEFVGGALGGALMSGGRAVADKIVGQPKQQPAAEQMVDVEATPVPQLGPGQTPGKPQPGRPPKAMLEKAPIAAGPVGEQKADPFAPQHVDVDGQKMVLVRNEDGTYRGYNVSEGQALVPVQRKRGQENTAETEGPIPQGGVPQARIEGREQKLLPGEVQKPAPRVFRSSEGLYFEEQPDGSYRGVKKPAPGKPPAGLLEAGPTFHMGPRTERGNRNKAGEQGPFAMPGVEEGGSTKVEEPSNQVESTPTQVESTPVKKSLTTEQPPKSTPVEKAAENAELADDPWESFADDLSQAGVSIPHMVNSFKKNFNLDLEKEVREGRFGTDKISLDQLKDLAIRYPQKGPKPTPRKRTKEPAVSLEDQLAASLRDRGIEVPAEPTSTERPVSGAVKMSEEDGRRINPVELDIWRERAKPLNDLSGKPTGWKELRQSDGVMLIHEKDRRVVTFKSQDDRSGTGLRRAGAEAHGWAIDNRTTAGAREEVPSALPSSVLPSADTGKSPQEISTGPQAPGSEDTAGGRNQSPSSQTATGNRNVDSRKEVEEPRPQLQTTADAREEAQGQPVNSTPKAGVDVPAQGTRMEAPKESSSTPDGIAEPPRKETAASPGTTQPQATAAEQPKREYSSTQVQLPENVGKRMKEASARIPDADLAEDGREEDPHVTVKYGLHGEDAEEVRKLLAGEGPIRVKLGKSSLFENDDADVLKVDVESEDLRLLNAKIAALPNSDKHPDYKPHATIAYLKPGSGKKYAGKPVPGVSGKEVVIDRLTFSGKNGEKVEIPLGGETKTATIETIQTKPETKAPTVETKAPVAETTPARSPQAKIIESVRKALDEDGDVIELEKIAEGVYGAKRTSGAWTKRQAYEAQEAGINSWMRDRAKDVMAMDPKKAIGFLRGKVKRLATQSVRDDQQIQRQQFSTPPHLAYLAQKVANVTKDDSVLEPSGGTGGLVSLVLPIAKRVHLNEIDPERAALAREVGFESQSNHNAEVINALLPADVKPTVVIMNPPFSMGGFNEKGEGANRTLFGYQHVESALQRLQPGGRLVAILSGGMEGRNQGARLTAVQAAKFFERIAKQYNIRANVGIPGKEYSKYGTSFPTRLVVIDKNGPTPGQSYGEQIKQAVKGDFDSIEEAWDALAGIAADRGVVASDEVSARDGERGSSVGADSGSIQQPSGTRTGDAGADRPAKGTRPGRSSTRPDAQVRSGDVAQPDSVGKSEVRPSQDGKDASGRDSQSPVQQPDDLTAAAGLTPEQLIAQVTQNIQDKRNPKPAEKPKKRTYNPDRDLKQADRELWNRAREITKANPSKWISTGNADWIVSHMRPDNLSPSDRETLHDIIGTPADKRYTNREDLPRDRAEAKRVLQEQFEERKAAKQAKNKSAPASVNPLKQQADAARDRLRAKMRGQQLNSGIDPQDLIDIATIGAEKMIDGATKFDAWAKSMREDVGDLIDWMAKTTKQTAEKVLRTIHNYAKQVAKNFNVDAEDAPAESEGDVAVKRRQKQTAKEDAGAFVVYEPTLEGTPHPGAIVESKSMATVSLPPLVYEPKLPAGTKISAVQLESVVIAGQQNERRNGDGSRGAALIGDGTGVGKGRTVAAMVLDNWNQGRKRILWVSEKWDLIEDAKRDLEGIGAGHLAETLVGLNKLDNKGAINLPEGVVFTTYDLIRSKDKKGNTTVSTLEVWLKGADEAEGAFVAFDEAHEMKNTVPAGRAQASQMGVAAKKLRDALPNLRTVYMSATSATEVENMGYLERLGLWGPRTPFPNGFAQFVNEVGSGGIATMELIARELKATGKYIARTLSYKGVRYDNVEAELNPDQREIYRKAATAWRMVTSEVDKAIVNVNGGREARSQFMSQYWSANQRFFNLLLTALKVPAAIELSERGLADGKSIVITLQNTNEAAQNRQEAKIKGEEEGDPDDLDFGPRDILINLVKEHYPVQQWVDVVVTGVDGKQKLEKRPLTRKDPETGKDVPVLNPQAIAQRDALVKQLERDLHMPANPLDILMEHFGRDNVAELTGRSKYYDAATGKFEKRGGDLPRKKVNIAAAQDFQDGRKRVAILSQAAGTGISLHASNDAKNQQQRWHITLQAGWSADKAMRMLGRTHRTNQKHTPHYFTLVSDMSGEKRFLATIAKRMGSLGALTRGSAEATGGADMSNVNYESAQGQQAAVTFVSRLESGQQVPGVAMDGFSVLREMGLTKKIERNGIEQEVVSDNAADVRRILNRLLALDPDIQQKVFEYYHQIFEAAVQQAVEQGTLDTGVKEFQGDSISIDEQRVLSADRDTGAETHYYRVTVHEKAPVATVEDLDKAMKRHPDGTFYVNSRTMHVVFAREADHITDANGRVREAVKSIRPSNKNWVKNDKPIITDRSVVMDLDTLIDREVKDAERDVRVAKASVENDKQRVSMYEKSISGVPSWVQADQQRHIKELAAAEEKLAEWKSRESDRLGWVKELWENQYEDTPKTTSTEHHLIGGAVLRWWNTVKQNQGIRLARDSKTGERVVGAVIAPAQIQAVLAQIAGGRVQVSAGQIITDVLRNGTEYQLEHGLRLRRGRVSRDQVIQVTVPDQQTGRVLIDLGVIYEKGITPVYYLPNEQKSHQILESVLAQYPVDSGTRSSEAGFASPELFGAHLIARGITKVEEWLKRMVERYGPEIRKRAMAIYREAKRLAADEQGSLDLTGLRNAGTKAASTMRDAYDVALKSMGARIKDESPRLAAMLQHARDVGDVMAGGFLNRLIDAKLNKLTKIEQSMLADVLEGKMKRAPRKVVDAYRVVRNLEADVAAIAHSLGVDPAKVLSRKYEQDTARSIPHQFAAAGEKLAQFAEFGKNNAELKKILKALGDVGGNPKQIKEWVERIFKGVDEGKTQEEKVTRLIRALQTAKLGLAFVPNASQAILNVTPASDFRALWAGYKALMSAEGRRFAVESGAAIDPVLAEAHQELGLGWLTQKFMTPFRLVEQHNRIVAASAGADFAARLWKIAQKDTKKGKWAARKLADLGVDASTPLTRADILMAAKKFTDQTQFRSRPENLPAWTTTPWGRVFFQFKQFSYQQARFTLDQTIGELRRGDPLRAGRNLAMFALLGGGMGELIRLLRNLLTGREDDPEGMERVAKAMASAGALGVMLDATQAMERGKELEWLAGPGADMGINAARLGWTWINPDKDIEDKAEATKKFVYRHAPLGSVARGVEERLQ